MPTDFRGLQIEDVYSPGLLGHNVLRDFFIPALSQSVTYSRVAGYFSSTVIASAARGISGFVGNGGKYRLVTSHAFTPNDHRVLDRILDEKDFERSLLDEFESELSATGELKSALEKDHFAAMCWLLANDILEIKVVIPKVGDANTVRSEIDLFHPKFGILTDELGNELVFAGSLNESTNGWLRNAENLSVYRSWSDGQDGYVRNYKTIFERYWNNDELADWICVDLPEAVKSKLVNDFAPSDKPDFEALNESALPVDEPSDGLRKYQRDALESWVDNNHVGMMVMATGSGKTRTANACIKHAQSLGSTLTVVIAPYQHICDQWGKELVDLRPMQINSGGWRKGLQEKTVEARLGRTTNLTIVVVKNTASSVDFVSAIDELQKYFKQFMLVGDEVHWLGATSFQSALNPNASLRLGLSATPQRYFDPEGTEVLTNYFGGTPVYEFSLRDALAWKLPNGSNVLCPYEYFPVFVDLSPDENEEYLKISRQIATLMSIKNKTPEDRNELEMARIRRAAVAKSAESKIPKLGEVLDSISQPLTQCLIYCADLAQMEKVAEVLNSRGLYFQRITGKEGTRSQTKYGNRSEREFIIENFARGELDVLLAVDCLDEGVDIPSAQMGIILASSGNSKEFIQRRGRLMRNFPGKVKATIFDFVVLPEDEKGTLPAESLRQTELRRIDEFAADAMNEEFIIETISHLS